MLTLLGLCLGLFVSREAVADTYVRPLAPDVFSERYYPIAVKRYHVDPVDQIVKSGGEVVRVFHSSVGLDGPMLSLERRQDKSIWLTLENVNRAGEVTRKITVPISARVWEESVLQGLPEPEPAPGQPRSSSVFDAIEIARAGQVWRSQAMGPDIHPISRRLFQLAVQSIPGCSVLARGESRKVWDYWFTLEECLEPTGDMATAAEVDVTIQDSWRDLELPIDFPLELRRNADRIVFDDVLIRRLDGSSDHGKEKLVLEFGSVPLDWKTYDGAADHTVVVDASNAIAGGDRHFKTIWRRTPGGWRIVEFSEVHSGGETPSSVRDMCPVVDQVYRIDFDFDLLSGERIPRSDCP
jgi:hypothetical protein